MLSASIDPRCHKARLCACLRGILAASCIAPHFAHAGTVQNCGDGGPGSGSLRDLIGSAQSGETIDLSVLPTSCGMMDSVITLGSEIVISQKDLTLQGPSKGSVTIRQGGMTGRIFNHTGAGWLDINALGIADGRLDATGFSPAEGACVYTAGSVSLVGSSVRNCGAYASGGGAFGGGVFANGSAVLIASAITGSSAYDTSYRGAGGAVYTKQDLTVFYSTLTGNLASDFGGAVQSAGGTNTYSYIGHSTLDHNSSGISCGAAGLYSDTSTVLSNSTISDNTAKYDGGGLCVEYNVEILNSTIAFNEIVDPDGGRGSGVFVWSGDSSLSIQSSIVARNTGNYDLEVGNATTSVSGGDNLIITWNTNVPTAIVKISSDPELGPLAFNGGRVRTRRLLPGSPAIGSGNNAANSATDERGNGYPRTDANATDMGAVQFDSIFADAFAW